MRLELRALFADAGLAWSTPEPSASVAAKPNYPDMPTLAPGDGGEAQVDPKYIQDRIHKDLFPLALDCYTDALKKSPKLAGRLNVYFRVVGDPKIGGVVDETKMLEDTTIDDADFQRCVRESMMSVTFDAPPDGGMVTVVYPIDFSPDDDGG